MGRWHLLIVAVLLAGAFAGCVDHGRKDLAVASRPDEPGASQRPGHPPGQAKKGGFSGTSVFPGEYRATSAYSYTLQKGPYEIGKEQVANVPMGTDGANLQIGYVLPQAPAGKQFPVIVQASIYYNSLKEGVLRTSYNSNPEHSPTFLIDNYVPHGYAVAFVPIRGTAGNGGCYEWWSESERKDLQASLDWIKAQEWSADRIGLIGLSMSGAAAWTAAGLGDPAIKTIVPVASEVDLYSWFVRNGTPSLLAAPLGTTAFWGLYSVSPFNDGGTQSREPTQIPNGAACPGVPPAVAANAYMTATGSIDPLGHAAARDLRPHVESNYRGSIFLIHGLHDWLAPPHLVYPWVNQLEERGTVVKHLVGQWRHRMPDDNTGAPFFQPTRRADFAEILLHWFDYWLKEDVTVDLGPRAQVADDQNRWRNEERWPPLDATTTRLYPAKDDKLGGAPGAEATYVLAPDPRRSATRTETSDAGPCAACATFRTPPLSDELQIAGLPALKATVTPLGPGGVLTAYLYAVKETSRQRIGWATLDLRYADGGKTFDVVQPGTTMAARLQFEPLDAAIPAGSSLQVEISQGGYGEDMTVLVPNNQGLAPAAYYRSSTTNNPIQLHVGGDKTVLELPTIERMEFFATPTAIEVK